MTNRESKHTHWAEFSEAGALWGIRFLFFCYRVGGKPLFKLFLAPVITYFFLFRSSNRRASVDYIRRIQQRLPAYHSRNTYVLSFQQFWNFALAVIDKLAVWMGNISRQDTTVCRGDIITRLCDRGQGAILLISHLGNFEICRALSADRKNFRLTVLMHTQHAENFNRLLQEQQQDRDIEIIQVTEITPATAMMLNERLERGEFIAISGDRVAINNPDSNIVVNFMGDTAYLPAGPFILAAILKAPLVSIFCLREQGRYHIYFDWLSERVECSRRLRQETIERLAQAYAGLIENYCYKAPLQWFNFYDFWARPGFGDGAND